MLRYSYIYVIILIVIVSLQYINKSTFSDSTVFTKIDKDLKISSIITLKNYNSSINLCNLDTFNNGKWVEKELIPFDVSEKEFTNIAGYTCDDYYQYKCYPRDTKELQRSIKIYNYEWQPNCKMAQFRAENIVKYLVNKPLLFVGDSISGLQFNSLKCLLGAYTQSVNNTIIKDNKTIIEWVRSDYLVRLDDFKLLDEGDEPGYLIGRSKNLPWIHLLPNFKIVVLNTATHWRSNRHIFDGPDIKDVIKAYDKAVNIVLNYFLQYPNHKLYYRAGLGGHTECNKYNKPLDTLVGLNNTMYNWDSIPIMNDIWKNKLSNSNYTNWKYMPVTYTEYRADTHSAPFNNPADCLHTCLPGPVDLWNKILFHDLMSIEK